MGKGGGHGRLARVRMSGERSAKPLQSMPPGEPPRPLSCRTPRNFVIATFVSGLVISLLELACTGQVYAPIIYQIQHGRLDAVLWLVINNLAFVTPLIVIFLLAYGGLRSETLIGFQKRHTFAVKLALALFFLGLALFIFLGSRLL